MFRVGAVRGLATEAAQAIKPKIMIQPAIKRSPTDLLKALSSTVGVDPTAPHFAFVDDPAMIPTTAANKRNFFMAKELGKRAARQLAEEWPTLFAFDRDLPRLSAFRPQKLDDPSKVDPTEENLLRYMEKRQIQDAAMLYERIRSEDLKVSETTQLDLFKLIAYYNGRDVPFSELENWHGLRTFAEQGDSQWTQAGLADLMYEVLPHTEEVNSTMIAALCKHASKESVHRAKNILKEMLSSKQEPHVEAFTAICNVCEYQEAKAWASKMKEAGVKPNTNTFNSLIVSVNKISKWSERVSLLEKVFGEMTVAHVKPNLRTLDLVLSGVFQLKQRDMEKQKDDAEQEENDKRTTLAVSWLSEILNYLEKSEKIPIQTASDANFFLTAMNVAHRAGNMDIANHIIALYESDMNCVKMPAFTLESIFYNRYLLLFIERSTDTAAIEKIYKSYVPRLVGLSRQLTMSIADKLKVHPSWTLLHRLIEDGIASRQMTDIRAGQIFRELLLGVNYQNLSPTEREHYSSLINRVVDIWTEFSRFTEDYNRRMQVKLSPGMIADCALLLTRIGEEDRAFKMLEMILDTSVTQGDGATVMATGYARYAVIMELFEFALRNQDAVKAAVCLEILSSQLSRSKLEPLAQRILERCDVTPTQARIVNGFVRLRPQ